MTREFSLMKLMTLVILFVTSLFVTNACHNEDVAPDSTLSSVKIGTTGGQVTGTDGKVSLDLPEGAVGENTVVSIQQTVDAAQNGIGKIYTLTPEGTQFAKPVKLSFHYTDEDVAKTPLTSMAIAFKNSDNTWQVMPTLTVDETTKTLTTETTHFSQWTLLEVPSITSFSPASGKPGSVVTITGTNFSTTVSENTVMFNGVSAVITSASATSLVVVVPAAGTSGKILLNTIFSSQSYTAVSATDFTVEPNDPTITSFSPANGFAGTTVTITGTNFSTNPSDNKVFFNGAQVPAVATISDTEIIVVVPQGATSGKIQVITQYNNLNWTMVSTTDFTVDSDEPVITGISPASGPVGTTVTITGKNFSTIPSDNQVLFNGVSVPAVATLSSTQIVVVVPKGATSGKVLLLTMYKTLNWTVVSDTDFTVQ